MHAHESQPAHVADLPATELGGSGINSMDGHHVPQANAAAILPSTTSRYPLVPPAAIKDCKRPWDRTTTTDSAENERGHLPLRQDRRRPWDKPNVGENPSATALHGELQSTPELPVVPVGPAVVAASPPGQIEVSNVLDMRPRKSKRTRGILLLCGGRNI